MKIVTRQTKANGAAKRWKHQYPNGRKVKGKDVYGCLMEMGEMPDPDEVDRLIGNGSWTRMEECDECGNTPKGVVLVGSGEEFVFMCLDCLRKAVKLLEDEVG